MGFPGRGMPLFGSDGWDEGGGVARGAGPGAGPGRGGFAGPEGALLAARSASAGERIFAAAFRSDSSSSPDPGSRSATVCFGGACSWQRVTSADPTGPCLTFACGGACGFATAGCFGAKRPEPSFGWALEGSSASRVLRASAAFSPPMRPALARDFLTLWASANATAHGWVERQFRSRKVSPSSARSRNPADSPGAIESSARTSSARGPVQPAAPSTLATSMPTRSPSGRWRRLHAHSRSSETTPSFPRARRSASVFGWSKNSMRRRMSRLNGPSGAASARSDEVPPARPIAGVARTRAAGA